MSVHRSACVAALLAILAGCSGEAEPPAAESVETIAPRDAQIAAAPRAQPQQYPSPEQAYQAACQALARQNWRQLAGCLGDETVNVTAGHLLSHLLSSADPRQAEQTLKLLQRQGVNENVVAAVEQRADGNPDIARRELMSCINDPRELLAGLLTLLPPQESPFSDGMELTELRPYREMAFARVMHADQKRWEPIEFRQTAVGWRIDLPTGLRCVPARSQPEPKNTIAAVEEAAPPRIAVPVEEPPITEQDRARATAALQSLGTVVRDDDGRVFEVRIHAEQLADGHFAALGMLPELRRVELSNSRDVLAGKTTVTAAQLGRLAGLSSLESLHLETYALDETGLESIGRLSNLRELHLTDRDDVPLSAASLAHLGRLTQLRRLSLSARIDQRGLQHLAGLGQLEWLYLGRGCPVRIEPELVDTLRKLPALQSLYVYVEGSSVEQVSRLGSLRGLASLTVVLLDQPGEEVRTVLRESLANARVDVTSYR